MKLSMSLKTLRPRRVVLAVLEVHAPMDTLSLTKEARVYNGEKTISLTSGAEKTGQPLVQE